jgi:hypothetical protein
MAGPKIGRVYVEIAGDPSPLRKAFDDAIATAKSGGVKITGAVKSVTASFQNSLNPTLQLSEHLKLLEKEGAKAADIWRVYGDSIKSTSNIATKHQQAIDPLVQKHLAFGKSLEASKMNMQGLGQVLTNFAQNPLQATQDGISALMTNLGPTAVGFIGLAGGVAAAGAAMWNMASAAAATYEHLENLSTQTGVSVGDLQALTQIAKEAGLESLDLGRTIGMLNVQLAEGKGDFVDALEKFNIQLVNLTTGKPKDAIQLLDALRAELLKLPEGAERSQAAQAALGGRLRELIPLLLNGKMTLRELIQEQERWGVVTSKTLNESLQKFDQLEDKSSRVWVFLKNLFGDIAAGTGWTKYAESLSRATDETNRLNAATQEAIGFTKFIKVDEWDLARSINEAYEARKRQREEEEKANKVLANQEAELRAVNARLWAFKVAVDSFNPSLIENNQLLEEQAKKLRQLADIDFQPYLKNLEELDKVFGKSDAPLLTAEDTLKRLGDQTKQNTTAMQGFGQEVSTIFTNMVQSIADNIVEWKGWANSILGTVKSLAKALLSTFLQSLFKPLLNYLSGIGDSIGGWLGGIFGGKGGAGSAAGGVAGAAGGLGGTAAGANAAAFGTGLGGTIGGGLGAFASMIGPFLPMAGIGAAIGAGAYGIYKLVDKIKGPNAWEAMSKEISRDYGGVNFSAGAAELFGKQFGITEKEAWGVRKNITSSPAMLQAIAAAAQQQGKLSKFMGSLTSVGISPTVGSVDMLTPYKKGMATGDWSALNDTWAKTIAGTDFGSRVTGGASSMYLGGSGATSSPTFNVSTGNSPITIHIHGAGDDLVTRIKRDVIPILKEQMTGGNSGLREAIVRAYNQTARAY